MDWEAVEAHLTVAYTPRLCDQIQGKEMSVGKAGFAPAGDYVTYQPSPAHGRDPQRSSTSGQHPDRHLQSYGLSLAGTSLSAVGGQGQQA